MIIHIHYQANGEISGWETTQIPETQPDLKVASFDIDFMPNPLVHKIDVETVTLVDKTDEEKRIALLPSPVTKEEMVNTIKSELYLTDEYMMPDRPISSSVRGEWINYRQMLRDLSKLPTPAEMVEKWTPDPNGNYRISKIRARHTQLKEENNNG